MNNNKKKKKKKKREKSYISSIEIFTICSSTSRSENVSKLEESCSEKRSSSISDEFELLVEESSKNSSLCFLAG